MYVHYLLFFFFFFFHTPATPDIYTPLYTLSLHDALPISQSRDRAASGHPPPAQPQPRRHRRFHPRSEEHTSELQSHSGISYAVFCLKKKKKINKKRRSYTTLQNTTQNSN